MDFGEGALKERFATAVSGMSPDVPALMDAGVQRGVRLQRRRRVELFGAAGLSAAAAAAVMYSGFAADLFDSNSTGPADTRNTVIEQINQPARPRSLAAAALEHLRDERVIRAGSMSTEPLRSTVLVSVAVDTSGGKAQLDLFATNRHRQWNLREACVSKDKRTKIVVCRRSTADDGAQIVVVMEKYREAHGPSTYVVGAIARRADQVVGIMEYPKSGKGLSQGSGQIVRANLPVSVATLLEIVTDPRFGMLTTSDMIAKGSALENFTNGPMVETRSGSSSSVRVAPPRPTGPQAGPQTGPQQPSSSAASAPAPERPGETAASSGP